MRNVLLFFIFLVIMPISVYAQGANLRSEKIVLRIDSVVSSYVDTLYMSGSLWEAGELTASIYSRYVYVELIDGRDSVLCRKKWKRYPTSNRFRGCMPLEVTRSNACLYLRAYTRLMCNFSEKAFTVIPYCPGDVGRALSPSLASDVSQVRFYPEGGHLVPGFPQTMAFLAQDSLGNPVRGKASLLNEKGDVIASDLAVSEYGIGECSFIPELGQRYSLRMGVKSYPCPEPDPSPALRLRQNRGRIFYEVIGAENVPEAYEFALFHRGQCKLRHMIDAGRKKGMVELADFSSGVVAGVLLDSAGRMVSDRLLFFRGKEVYGKEALDARDSAFLLVLSDLEFPVSYLSSHLHVGGDPQSPDLNTWMLLAKWSRFEWEDALCPDFKYAYPPEEIMALSGEVETESGRPLKEGSVIAYNNTNGGTYEAKVINGRFTMGVDDYPEHTRFFLQAYNRKGKPAGGVVRLDPEVYPPVVNALKDRLPGNEMGKQPEGELIRDLYVDKDGLKTYQIQEITVSAKARKELPETKDFYGVNYIGEEMLETPEFPSLLPYLERMIGFEVIAYDLLGEERFKILPTRGMSVAYQRQSEGDSQERDPNEMVILLDGQLIDTTWAIHNLHAKEIASIERLTPAQALRYTSFCFSGAILVKTKGYKKSDAPSSGNIYQPMGLSNLDSRDNTSQIGR